MNLLSRRSVLAIAAVVDVALHSRSAPVAAKALAARHKLPPRHLETLLQGLVHAKILKGVRGPRGGYELARERRRITVGEIVRTAMSLSTADPEDLGANSVLLERVIDPAVRKAGETFLANLDSITVEQMCETAEKAHVLDDEKVAGARGTALPGPDGPVLAVGGGPISSLPVLSIGSSVLVCKTQTGSNREAPLTATKRGKQRGEGSVYRQAPRDGLEAAFGDHRDRAVFFRRSDGPPLSS